MALTTVEYTYSGQASFAIPFSLGILNRAYVTIQINNQVDGSGDPLYYTNFTWTSDSEVVINGLTNGDIIKIARTIPSNLLLSDYTAGSNITRDNLNIANKQLIMLIHEVLDKNVTQQTKLDTIESGATGDQTAAEIKIAYESNANTNAFTDADESKLDGIEAGADITDTANVTAAGAVMDSEVTDLAGIKAVTVSTLQVKPSEGAFVDGDKTKLNSIETNADVTDTANVVASLTAGTNITIASDGTIASTAAGGGGGLSDIVEDLTPELGGNLDLNGQDITGTGNISITGTVNGRDVASDGTKLDGIESGATADQTAAQIKTAYESNADTNAFTDADHTKLDGIEAAADVTDTTNVVAALTAGTNVTIAANGTISSTDTNTTYTIGDGGLTTNDFTNADHSKLDGIEASADVTDTANVTAAGALMDSEVTNLAQVKAFDSSDYATSAQGTTADAALPKAGGTMTGDILFNDGVKAKFGNSNDLQIWHNGTDSYVYDTGAGDLILRGSSNIKLQSAGGTALSTFTAAGASTLYYSAAEKLATTSTGIGVTGKIGVGDAGTVADHELHIQSASPTIRLEDTDGNKRFDITQSGNDTNLDYETNMLFKKSDGTEIFRIDTAGVDVTGDVSLSGASTRRIDISNTSLADTGEMATLQWDNSANLTIQGRTSTGSFAANWYSIQTTDTDGRADAHIFYTDASTERMRIDSGGIDVTGAIDVATSGASNTSSGLAIATSGTNFESDGGIISIDHAAIGAVTGGYFSKYSAGGTLRHSVKGDGKGYFAGGLDVTGATNTTGTQGTRQWSAGSAGQKLGIYAYDNSTFYHRLETGNATNYQWGAYDNIPIYTITNNTIRTTLLGNGNFGINSTNPTQKLEVAGKIQVTSADPEIFLTDTTTGVDHSIDGNSGIGNLFIHVDKNNEGSDPKLIVNVGATDDLIVATETGNVGISHASPVAKMAILGSSNSTITEANSNLCVEGSGGNGLLFGTLNTTGFKSYIQSGFVANLGTATYDLLLNPEGGNVGINTATPAAKLDVRGDVRIEADTGFAFMEMGGPSGAFIDLKSPFSDDYDLRLQQDAGQSKIRTTGNSVQVDTSSGYLHIGPQNTSYCHFTTDRTRYYFNQNLVVAGNRVVSSYGGDLLLQRGQSSTQQISLGLSQVVMTGQLNISGANPSSNNGAFEVPVINSSTPAIVSVSAGTTSLRTHHSFENSNGQVGKINTLGTQTFYVTSSDYRLKADIQPMQGSIDRVKALKPCNFEWINDGGRVDGFIAHEVEGVVPESIVGEKDGMRDKVTVITPLVEATYDDEGNELTPEIPAVTETEQVPDYQGIDQSKLVPLLTSALQDAISKIEELELRIVALEN